jgi:hypothetical protein
MITIDKAVLELVLDALQHGITEMNHRGSAIKCMPLHIAAKALREAVLTQRAAQPQRNTTTHSHLSTMIGLVVGARGKGFDYKDGSTIDKEVQEAIAHLKDWPYPADAQPAAQTNAMVKLASSTPLQDGGLCAVEPCRDKVQPQPEYDPFLPTGARIARGMKAKPD